MRLFGFKAGDSIAEQGEQKNLNSLEFFAAARGPQSHSAIDIPRARVKHTARNLTLAILGVAVLLGVMVRLRNLKAAAPNVERASLWMDTVRRGPMVREVLGQGTLVSEEVRWLAAKSSARIERVLVKPGAAVAPETVILEMSNSDMQLQALEADRQLAQGEAELVNLQATLNSQKLSQQSVVATLRSELADAGRRAHADEELAKRGFLSELELGQTRGHAAELHSRLRFENERVVAQSRGMAAQLQAQKAQVDRLRSIAEFRRKEVTDLEVRAALTGVVQVLTLQPGQAVAPGALLAKVVNPSRLKAEMKIPETQAKDVQLGQKASIDTRNGLVAGHVVRMDPAAQSGTVVVDVAFDGALPAGARPDLNIEGTIEIERIAETLYLGRPAQAQVGGTVGLFKLEPDGNGATRAIVKLGCTSVKSIQIVSGLEEGERVILSDMSQWDRFDRIRLR